MVFSPFLSPLHSSESLPIFFLSACDWFDDDEDDDDDTPSRSSTYTPPAADDTVPTGDSAPE